MKRLVWDDDIEEIDLGDDDFVNIGRALTIKDITAIGAGENQMETSLRLLQHLIRSWRGPSFVLPNGEVAPVTPDNIGRLDMAIASGVASTRMSEEVKKDLVEISPSTSTTP